MKKILILIDIQKDFVDGALGTKEALAMIPAAVEKIRSFDGDIFVTFDTHYDDYMQTSEGKKLPVPHCIRETEGWELHPAIKEALAGKKYTAVEKPTFGSVQLPQIIRVLSDGGPVSFTVIGLCTDICVVSNALLLKAHYPETAIAVDAACCAGVTPAAHEAALATMRSCQIDILNAD